MSDARQMRLSDHDRERVAARLRDAHADGRLTEEEFLQRLDAAYTARTAGDVEPLLFDLPAVRPPGPAPAPSAPPADLPARQSRGDQALRGAWTAWGICVAVNIVIWALVTIGNHSIVYFWPAWVAGPWGAVLLVATLSRRRLR